MASKCRSRSTGRPSCPRNEASSAKLTEPSSGNPIPRSQRPKAISGSSGSISVRSQVQAGVRRKQLHDRPEVDFIVRAADGLLPAAVLQQAGFEFRCKKFPCRLLRGFITAETGQPRGQASRPPGGRRPKGKLATRERNSCANGAGRPLTGSARAAKVAERYDQLSRSQERQEKANRANAGSEWAICIFTGVVYSGEDIFWGA